MRIAPYMRKSVDRDNESRCVSVQAQLAEIEAWAKEQGHSIVRDWIVNDRDFSGASARRPGFQRLLASARSGSPPFDAVVVTEMDRFFRGFRKQQRYIDEFEDDCGVKIIALDEIGNSALEANMKSVINEEERERGRRRTIRAMRDIASRGLSCGGTAPYGYRATRLDGPGRPVKWELDPKKAEIVRRIFESYVGGASYRSIARVLNREGVQTPGAGTLRSGKGWASTAVRAVLLNEMYTGVRIYGQTRKVSRKPTRQVRVPPEQWIRVPNAHAPIVDEELWDRVQARRRQKSRRSLARGPGSRASLYRRYLPSGYLKCASCGGVLTVKNMNRGHKYYACRRASEAACATPGGPVRMDIAEAHIATIMRDGVLDPQNIRRFQELLGEEWDRAQVRSEVVKGEDDLRVEIRRLDKEISNLILFLRSAKESQFGGVRHALGELEAEKAGLKARLAGLSTAQLGDPPSGGEIETELANLRAGLELLTLDERHELMSSLNLVVVVGPGKRATVEVEPGGLLKGGVRCWDLGSNPPPGTTLSNRLSRPCGRRLGLAGSSLIG